MFRWMAKKFLSEGATAAAAPAAADDAGAYGSLATANLSAAEMREAEEKRMRAAVQGDSPPCSDCGEIMIRNGACYACLNCGATSGCS